MFKTHLHSTPSGDLELQGALAIPLHLASRDESVFTIQTGWIWTAGASLCQPPEWDGDQPQPGGGGAHAGRPGPRGHVPGGHLGQAGQRDAQRARLCCFSLSSIYHLIPRHSHNSTLCLLVWDLTISVFCLCFGLCRSLWGMYGKMVNKNIYGMVNTEV